MKRTVSPIIRIPDNTSLSQLKRQDLKRSKILTLQQCHPIGTNTLGLVSLLDLLGRLSGREADPGNLLACIAFAP
jgi:hypothetical protein